MAENIMDLIYGKLHELFGSDRNQLFLMEFPGRVLDPDVYAYPVDDAYAQITKPQPIVEAEFRLTNDLFDPAQVTGGPNGRKLTAAYEAALNTLVPAIAEQQVEFMEDRQRIRRWLEEEVQAEVPGDDDQL